MTYDYYQSLRWEQSRRRMQSSVTNEDVVVDCDCQDKDNS